MQLSIKKSILNGDFWVPPSKSQTLRAILFGALGKGKSVIHNYLEDSPDTLAMIEACRNFGAKITILPKRLEIQGVDGKISAPKQIEAQNSGIVLRFCSAIAALSSHKVTITGDPRRPMDDLLNGLAQLGVEIEGKNTVKGPIKGGRAIIDGEDSQPVSALLIAGAFASHPIEIEVKNPGEKPWVAVTLDWFDRLGLFYENSNFTNFYLKGHGSYEGFEYFVLGDFSTAAFPIAAAIITNSELTLHNLDMHDAQGDKELITILQKMGANIVIDEQGLHVKKGSKLTGMAIDINNFVDALPILAVIGSFAEGTTILYNGKTTRQKECDRVLCMAEEINKMGGVVIPTSDGLIINKAKLTGSRVFSHNDHRVALALAVAGLGAEGETQIEGAECISKTFPNFLINFKLIGGQIS